MYEYLEAVHLAAEAGDGESCWLLAEHYRVGQRYSKYDYGAYKCRQDWLAQACQLRHPLAQRAWGLDLMFGGPLLVAEPYRGLKLWLSGFFGSWSYEPQSLPQRLKRLPSGQKLQGTLLLDGTRQKMSYGAAGDDGSSCGVRIHYLSSGDCQIVLEQLPQRTKSSVTNQAEFLATKVLYVLLLQSVDLNPATIEWFEAYPAGAALRPGGTLQRIKFDWDGVGYSTPIWGNCDQKMIRIKLDDILNHETE